MRWRHHIVMARLHGTDAILDPEHKSQTDLPWFKRGHIWFSVFHSRDKPVVSLECSGTKFCESDLGVLLDLLFDSGVLSYHELES
jgi:hypothetical protein